MTKILYNFSSNKKEEFLDSNVSNDKKEDFYSLTSSTSKNNSEFFNALFYYADLSDGSLSFL